MESQVLRIPSGVPLVDAAALLEASYLTCRTLSKLTNVTAGKTVLMHGTAGGTGMIALQYAKHVGCEVYFVAGMEEELQLCKTLGAEVCINYKNQDFCKRVMAETGEEGVDIILDFNGRDKFQKNLDCLAIDGSLVYLGHRIWNPVEVDLSVLMERDITVIGLDLYNLSCSERMSLRSDVAVKFWPLTEAEFIRPIIGKTFSFSEAGKAHRAFEEYSIPGKVLLVSQETTWA